MESEDEISDEQIEALRTEAGQHGDRLMVEICDFALKGDEDARKVCIEVIVDAATQED